MKCKFLMILCSLILVVQAGWAQDSTDNVVRGVVVDAQSETPILGATIIIEGTNNGTTTNDKGVFSIKLPAAAKEVSLNVSYIGYSTQIVPAQVGKRNVVKLLESAMDLDEVVVVGYGELRKSDVSGALSSVNLTDEASSEPSTSIDQLLQGRIAGVSIVQNSGAPGATMNVSIRGTSTISGDTQPLYVVDGFPIDTDASSVSASNNEFTEQADTNPLAMINPSDIESVQVLKDASATAIYGSRATNGVILITTKQGNEGEVKVTYNSRIDVSQVSKTYNLLNAYDYASYQNELDRTVNGYDISGNVINPSSSLSYTDEELELYKTNSTDWQDALYNTAISHEHQIAVTGGTKATKYNVSFGYVDQEGIILSSGLERYSTRASLTAQLYPKLKFQGSMNYSLTNQDQISHSQSSSSNSLIARILQTDPTKSIYDASYDTDEDALDGLSTNNPYIMVTNNVYVSQQQNLGINGSLTYEFTKGLTWRNAASISNRTNDRSSYYPRGTSTGDNYNGLALRSSDDRQNIVLESTLNYSKKIKQHRIDATLGFTHEDRVQSLLSAEYSDFPDDYLYYYSIGDATNTVSKSSAYVQKKISSFISRANYTYQDIYIFTLTGRYDGSSLLSEGNQWAFFPSAAFAIRINQYDFLKHSDWLSNMKLRISYGQTGNQSVSYGATDSVLEMTSVYMGDSQQHSMIISNMSNNALGWERTTSYNVGLDMGFVDNRFRFSVDAYQRITTDMLISYPLASSSGYSTVTYNTGQISNKGIEFEFNANLIKGEFRWDVGGNLYLNRNNVDDLGGVEIFGKSYLGGNSLLGSSINVTREGSPIGAFYGYVVDGVYQNEEECATAPTDSYAATPGSLKYVDISGADGVPDGKITTDDMTIIGNPEADFEYGINTDISWKKFTLSALFTGRVGGDIANLNNHVLSSYSGTRNITQEAWDGRWTGEGTSNYYPAVDGSKADSYFNARFTSFIVEDGSYFRMKNLTLAWQHHFPRKATINSLRIFATATNLFTITDYSGYDPEVSITSAATSPNVDYASYPSTTTYSLGFNLTF